MLMLSNLRAFYEAIPRFGVTKCSPIKTKCSMRETY